MSEDKYDNYIGGYYDFENQLTVDVSGKTVGNLLDSFRHAIKLAEQAKVAEIRSVTVNDQDEEGSHLIITFNLLDEGEYEPEHVSVSKPVMSLTDSICMLEIRFGNSNLLSDFKEIIASAESELTSFQDAEYLDVSYSSVAGDNPDPIGFFRVYFRK